MLHIKEFWSKIISIELSNPDKSKDEQATYII